MALYMVIERFRPGQAPAVYRRFREHGRMAPEGLVYVSSWVDHGFDRCFQVMETDDPKQIDEWTSHWSDLVEFEVIPVRTSAEAAAHMAESRQA
jgi:hypothetical protein